MITSRGRYAMRLVLDIAENQCGGCVSLADTAKRQGISLKYLESISAALAKADVIRSQRGRAGGYTLVKEPEQCTVYEVLCAVERTLAPVSCLEQPGERCPRAEHCATLPVWERLDGIINDYLSSVSVAELMNNEREQNE